MKLSSVSRKQSSVSRNHQSMSRKQKSVPRGRDGAHKAPRQVQALLLRATRDARYATITLQAEQPSTDRVSLKQCSVSGKQRGASRNHESVSRKQKSLSRGPDGVRQLAQEVRNMPRALW